MMETVRKSPLFRQVGRFGAVGIGATCTHIGSAFALHYIANLTPLWANFFAFLIAWTASFAGNHYWTFDTGSTARTAGPRFFTVSLAGLALNQLIVWFVNEQIGGSFVLAMVFVVTVVPTLSFLGARYWAFASEPVST